MKTEITEKTYKSSSAAYRAIRHYEAKNGKQDLVMEKIMKGMFVVKKNGTELNLDAFIKDTEAVDYDGTIYQYFDNGAHGAGYYELKKGDRRRPNSDFKSVKEVFADLQ